MEPPAPDLPHDVPPTPFELRAACVAKLNLADFQNAVPMLRELVAVNASEHDVSNVVLGLHSIPAFVKPRSWRIDAIGRDSSYPIRDLDVQLDGALLSKLTEAESATVVLTLTRQVGDSEVPEVLAQVERPVELLPRNQWGGLSHLPDMVAAFVQPNELAVDRLLKQAAVVLRDAGRSAAIDGYQGGPKKAWELASAIWSATAALGLDYALPPASFEHRGQKVRSPSQVMDARIATCLDLTLLFCAALEQAGLNPVIVFTKGHAFAGVWLQAEEFSTTVVDDVTAVRKRVKLKELVLFETTLITQRPAPSFSYATQHAAGQIDEDKDDAFEMLVDVRRARMQRIKPLASTEIQVAEPTANDDQAAAPPRFDEAPELPEGAMPEADPATLDPKDRLARWQRKLLDLSLRNNLLNFRAGKKALRLDAPDPNALEDLLSDGQAIRLLPRPELMEGKDPRDQVIYEQRSREDVRREHALDALRRREVFVGMEQQELEARLVDLYRAARTTLQEGGANTLYLAIGFLNWTRDDKAGQKYRAPLVLVPVTLQRRSARSGFTLTLHEDEPRFNPTLVEMLRQDFRLNLGMTDGELPRDEAGIDIDRIWKSVSYAVRDIKGWEVSEEVVLAMFSFAKYLMWVDLTQRTDQLRQNPVVQHLIDTPRDPYPSTCAFPDPRRLDAEFQPHQTFCPLPADSSQLSAVLAAARGKDFVLVGPPGTGKSQTISNLIAQCLAEGKRVLFVSEKIAALDVVHRRLREVGLGEFCLELHSSKARKVEVLAQLQRAWEAQGDFDPQVWQAQATKLARYRDELNGYVTRLHHRHRNGLTIYQAIGVVVDGDAIPSLALSWPGPDFHDDGQLAALRELVDRLAVNASVVGADHLLRGPLSAVEVTEWSPSWQQRFIDAARETVPMVERAQQAAQAFLKTVSVQVDALPRRARMALATLARALPSAAGHDWRVVFQPDARATMERLHEGWRLIEQHRELSASLSSQWSEEIIAQCRKGLALLQEHGQVQGQLGEPWSLDVVEELSKGLRLLEKLGEGARRLSVKYTDEVEQLNVHQLQRQWVRAEKSVWPLSWWRKRALAKVLDAVATGEGKPDVARDLGLLVKMRELKSELGKIEIGPATEGVWAGLKTRPEFAQAALKFQLALAAAKRGEAWRDEGFDAVANGRCGARLATELAQARRLRALDAEIASLESLGATTGGLWAGHATQPQRLSAALQFVGAVAAVREAGAIAGEHDAVANGDCGAAFAADLLRLRRRAGIEEQLRAFDDLYQLTDGTWAGLATQPEAIDKLKKFHASMSAAVANLAEGPERLTAIQHALGLLVGDGNALLDPGGPVAASGKRYLEAWTALQPPLDQLAAAGSFSEQSFAELQDLPLAEMLEHCRVIVQSEHRLHAWCAWRKVRSQALVAGLAPLVAALEERAVTTAALAKTFEANYCRWWLNAVVDQEPVIRTFVSAEHEKRIADFRLLDRQFTDLTRAWIRASLAAGLPKADGVSRNSEWGLLRHEMNKKKMHLPLRELIGRIPTALTQLTPCLLMSPLSVAQYLSPDASAFDVVVFDEASQIPVWDAIGAIARGKQVVMVGDPKQLPPTAFFDRAESSLDDEDVEADLESILDECLGANLPTMNLAWHYRSRNESLIAFSNHRYYGGGLVTFPSPVTDDRAVSFHHVRGVYEKGGARVNQTEAKAVVADIVARLKSPAFRESQLTIGVVTFNSEQMNLIEDLLDEERRKDPSIEPYFSEAELEPLFVKNLESVQGDERDIMYFSITYGPDLTGAVSMNFGPMNREGGERRLNVAITRARHELRVFSSLKAEQFDLSRTQAAGVRDLKHFLEFAERGPRALAEATKGSLGGFESPFEEAVATALTTRGWQVHTQIGASSFRVDLAVVHPDAPGTYLAGVECDGATYHRSATARDRDMLREQVLRGLGWEILRVWSTDWWIDRKGTADKLHLALEALLAASRTDREAQAQAEEAARVAAEEAISRAKDEGLGDLGLDKAIKPAVGAEVGEALREPPERDDLVVDELYARRASTAMAQQVPLLVESDPRQAVGEVNADAFFDKQYDEQLSRMILHVVETEGPVLDTVVARRIARAHGWARTGGRIQERVSTIAAKLCRSTEEEVGVFFWPPGRDPEEEIQFRRAAESYTRSVDEVCVSELTALARGLLAAGNEGEAVVIAMARELGLTRLRATSRARLERALQLARG